MQWSNETARAPVDQKRWTGALFVVVRQAEYDQPFIEPMRTPFTKYRWMKG